MKNPIHTLLLFTSVAIAFPNVTCASRALITTEINGEKWTTGKKVWEENRQVHQINTDNFLLRHPQHYTDLFDYFRSFHDAGTLYCPVDFKIISGISQDLNLHFTLRQGAILELNLYRLLEGTFIELITEMNTLIQNSAYARQDVTIIQKFAADSYVYLEGLKNILHLLYASQANDFNEADIRASLAKKTYKMGRDLEHEFNSTGHHFKTTHPEGINLLQWGETFCSFYQHYFSNTHVFTTAHLTSKDRTTKIHLKRYEPKLTEQSSQFFTNDILGRLHAPLAETPQPKKIKKKKAKHPTVAAASPAPQALEQDTPKDTTVDEVTAVLPVPTSPSLPVVLSTTQEPQPQPTLALETVQDSQDAAARQALKAAKKNAKKEEKAARLAKEHEGQIANNTAIPGAASDVETTPQQDARLMELNDILAEYEGGPKIGMKSRTLLGLLSTLSNRGFLELFTNGNEAVVKTDKVKSVLHVSQHSTHKKSPGASGNTVKKIHEIIRDIREGLSNPALPAEAGPSGENSAAATRGTDDSSDEGS